jgi:heme exporter protein A
LFENLNFDVASGDIVQIEGPNGSGKSTLLKILCGIYDEYEGSVEWQIDEAPLYLGHRPGVTDSLSVSENLSWLAGLHGQSLSQSQLANMLSAVGLAGYERVAAGNLSEGQRKRISLARYYGFNNRVWVMDEPFSAIDTSGVAALEARLTHHVQAGGSVILTSHQPLELEVPVRRLLVGAT